METYTIDYAGKHPRGVAVGTLKRGGARFVATTDLDDPTIAGQMIAADPLGARVKLALTGARSIIQSFKPRERA